jgi:pyrroloquinoline quinone (PQQ) biosynthesis protein C
MSEHFTETLKQASEPIWTKAVEHRFAAELFAGTISNEVMASYLVQDHRFLDSFLRLLGAAMATADTFEARLRFSRFTGLISGEANTYFLRAFEALGVTQEQRETIPDTEPTRAFRRSCARPPPRAPMPPHFSSSTSPNGLSRLGFARGSTLAGKLHPRRMDHAVRQS